MFVAAACSSGSAQNAVAPAPEQNAVDDAEPEEVTTSGDAGKRDGASKDAAPSKTDAAAGADGTTDAGIGNTPLACVTAAPTISCGSTYSATSTATSGIPLTEMGAAVSVAIDPSGQVHGAWTTPSTGVRYAASKTNAFTVETLALAKGLDSEVFLFPRVAVDSCGRPVVAYLHKHLPAGTDVTESHVYVMTKGAGGWLTREVEVPTSSSNASPATDIHTVSLTLDGADNPIVAMARWSSNSIYLARPTSAGFDIEEVPDALSVSVAGLPAVTYSSTLGVVLGGDVASKPTLMWKSGTTWNKSTVSTTHPMDLGRMLALAADAQGGVHLAWRQKLPATASTQQTLGFFHAASTSAGLVGPESVVSATSGPNIAFSQSLSMHVGPSNTPVVGVDGFPMRRQGATFVKTPVVTGIANYRGAAMALDASGRARVLAFGYGAGVFVNESCP